MADTKWTNEQLQAIETRRCNLLVAAAAGSGKTAVLVERIIRMITNEESPVDIDKLLVVTFTSAAASEMRERIASAISKSLEKSPNSKNLQRQLTLLSRANITTMHSFCLDVIKNYFYTIDLDPSFRIGDETEAILMKNEIIEELFEEYYEEGAYFRLQQAYLAYMSREYVVEERRMSRSIIDIICKEYEKGEETIDICKIAVLKYYSTREYTTTVRKTLKKFLQELCGKQIYFPFFLAYEKEWLIELQLWDKTLIEYKGQKGSRVMLYYQLQKENSEAVDYATEVLTPMYENLYVKKFVLFSNERLKYYFKETIDGNTYRSDKECCMKDAVFGESGRYGRLNDILLSEGSEKEEKMKAYAQEDAIAAHMFEQY